MPANDGRDIVIISDLHLSAGCDPRTGTYHRNEDFFYDDALGRFLDSLIAQIEDSSRSWRLVILGDFVDFLQVTLDDEPGPGVTSSEASAKRLERIGQGHPQAFAALARFVAAGHLVDIVLGNHDIELIWPDVQATCRQIFAGLGLAEREIAARLTFHPWIFHVPHVLYAEHGQQYDGINSFATLIAPFLPDQKELIELPLGSFFVRYMFNYIEQIDPFADNVKPPTRYVGWALRNHPVLGLMSTYKYAQFFVRSLPKTSKLSEEQQQARRQAYVRDVVSAAASQIGLPAATLAAIDGLAAIPALANLRSQLGAIVFRPLVPAIVVVSGGLGLHWLVQHLPNRARWFTRIATALAALTWRERRMLQPTTDNRDYLLATTRKIHALLKETGDEVPNYVFGHTHGAARSLLGDEQDSPHYFNSGTWTPIVPETFSLLTARELFTFVQITHDTASGELSSRLMLWNDAGGRAEPVPLLMSGGSKGSSFAASVQEKVRSAMGA